MDVLAASTFFVCAFVGSYVQSVAGFAMGMLIIAVMGASGLVGIPPLTAAVSLLSLVNVALALRGERGALHVGVFRWLAIGQVLSIWIGVALIVYLHASARWALELLLGAFITAGGLAMLLRPTPLERVSSRTATLGAGIAGGLVGGLFSASGPVLGWFAYRQPLDHRAIRATLLACFAVTTSMRTLVVGVQGGLTVEVWVLAAVGLPAVFVGTWLGRTYPPTVSEVGMRRFACALLLVSGVFILVGAIVR